MEQHDALRLELLGACWVGGLVGCTTSQARRFKIQVATSSLHGFRLAGPRAVAAEALSEGRRTPAQALLQLEAAPGGGADAVGAGEAAHLRLRPVEAGRVRGAGVPPDHRRLVRQGGAQQAAPVDRRLRELSVALGLEPALMKMELRPPTPLVTPRPRWVSEDLVEPEVPVVEGDKPFTNEAPVHEVVCYRLSAASAGCGIIANLLRTSGALVKLRLNNCQVTDAGAILLASGIRVWSALFSYCHRLSNEEFVYGDEESMENEVGKNGAQAIALVLERNQTVTRIDLSGNPIGVAGAHAFAEMLRKNTSLQSLQLDRTRIQDGAERLIDAFERSKRNDTRQTMTLKKAATTDRPANADTQPSLGHTIFDWVGARLASSGLRRQQWVVVGTDHVRVGLADLNLVAGDKSSKTLVLFLRFGQFKGLTSNLVAALR
ncbi:hypothetical protein ON010_g5755 [Phytophthora cinnamomi]|nr:hypothetical protein ON010_g5755 [Phytophthora cinnamomi]